MNKAYKFRLYPNKEQEVYFSKCFGCVRFIFPERENPFPLGEGMRAKIIVKITCF